MGGDQTCILRVIIQRLFSCIKKLQPICSIVEECSLIWRIWSGTKKSDLCFWLCVKRGKKKRGPRASTGEKNGKGLRHFSLRGQFFFQFYFGVSSQSSQLLFFIFFSRSPTTNTGFVINLFSPIFHAVLEDVLINVFLFCSDSGFCLVGFTQNVKGFILCKYK